MVSCHLVGCNDDAWHLGEFVIKVVGLAYG